MPLTTEEQALADRLLDLFERTETSLLEQVADAATSERARSRLRAMLGEVDRELDALRVDARAWIATDTATAYATGATHAAGVIGPAFAWTDSHRQAVQALAERSWARVAETLQGVSTDTKRAIRSLLDETVRRSVLEGIPGRQGRTEFLRALQSETGLVTVRYGDGSRHALRDWADTTARTDVALVRNAGEFAQSRAEGITYMACTDGLACGLSAHNDPVGANGLVLPIEVAESYPIAHPRCARSWSPAVGVTTAEQAKEATIADDPALVAVERARAALANVDTPRGAMGAERATRQPRQPRGPRQPRSAA